MKKNSKKKTLIFLYLLCVYNIYSKYYTVQEVYNKNTKNTVLYAQYTVYFFRDIFILKKYSAREPISGQTVQYSLK